MEERWGLLEWDDGKAEVRVLVGEWTMKRGRERDGGGFGTKYRCFLRIYDGVRCSECRVCCLSC